MSDSPDAVPFEWQKHESIAEKIAVCDLAAYLYKSEYRGFGSERHRAKARVRSAMARAAAKGRLAAPVSWSPKRLDVRNLLFFACERWPQLRDVISVFDSVAEVRPAVGMEIQVGNVEVEIDQLPSTYSELLEQYQSLRSLHREEKARRIYAELELEKLRALQSKRRLDGAKRYE